MPWIANSGSPISDVPALNNETASSYETNICTYDFIDFILTNLDSNNQIKLDKTSSIDCYSKINGIANIEGNFTAYVGTNINIDFILQSFFWLVLFSLIPVEKFKSMKNINISIFLLILLFLLHLRSENSFYQMNSKIFTADLNNNYLIFTLLITMYVILLTFNNLLENRFYNIINYLPFIFVISGTYNSLNLNFFVLCIAYLGISTTLRERNLQFGLLIVLIFSRYWQIQSIESYSFFDVDKIKGFSSSAFNQNSILFWSLIYYFFCVGFIYLIKKGTPYLDLGLIKKNFLLSGSLVVIFSLVAATGPVQNFLAYYYLGLNKMPSKTFESVSGNAWRGISPSAEGIGEFYAFILLFVLGLAIKNKEYKFNPLFLVLIFFNAYGLYRANNFAAVSSLIVLLGTTFVIYNISSNKTRGLLFVLLLVMIPYLYQSNSTVPVIEDLSRNLIKQSLNISYLDNFDKNQFGQTAIEQNRFLEILQQEEDEQAISSTLKYLIEKYHFSERNNLPNLTSAISAVAYPINRTKVWGIFIGKYNPDLNTFMLGSGVNQLSNYYLSHPTKINSGLVLPHSAILSYLIYFGIVGVLIITSFIIYKLVINRSNSLYLIFISFFILNIIKSDSLLYISNFMLFIFVLNLTNLENSGSSKTEKEQLSFE